MPMTPSVIDAFLACAKCASDLVLRRREMGNRGWPLTAVAMETHNGRQVEKEVATHSVKLTVYVSVTESK